MADSLQPAPTVDIPSATHEIVDLTHELRPGIPLGGPLPDVQVTPLWRLGTDIANISFVSFATHSGTHLDAPNHFIERGRDLRDIPMDWLCGPASFLRIDCIEHQAISADALERAGTHVSEGDRLVLRTGFCERYGQPGDSYHRHPYLATDAVEWILDKGVRLLAVDLLTPERPRTIRDDRHFDFPVHHRLLGSDVLIVENAAPPVDLPLRFWLSALPLSVSAADGAPIRLAAHIPTKADHTP